MNITKGGLISFSRTIVVLFFISSFWSRCASIMQPSGGPIDTLPPVILNITPDNFSTNLDGRDEIFIEFDEFVQLKDQNKEFYTSPQMRKKPILLLRGRGVAIKIQDTLIENTTYALNFGSSLQDNNEGNPLHSMRYVFSTGSSIDSMICSGYTSDSYKTDSVSKSFLYFYIADSVENVAEYDSTIFKYKPAVIARAETNGIFIAQNLKPIPYRVYAYEDTNDNQMYEPSVDRVGFISGSYNPGDLPDFSMWYDSIRQYVTADPQLYIRMFTDVTFKRQMLQDNQRPLQHKAMLYFGAANPIIESLVFDSIPAESIIIEPITEGLDTLALWFNVPSIDLPDTIKGRIAYYKHDSLSRLVLDTVELKLSWRIIESKEQEKEREKLERDRKRAERDGDTWVEPKLPNQFKSSLPTSGDINPENDLGFEFDYPIVSIDSSRLLMTVKLEDDIINDVPVRIVQDSADLRKWYIRSPWKNPGATYTLTIPDSVFLDVAGFTNDSIVGTYTLLDPDKLAKVKLNFKSKSDSCKYVVQLLDGNGKQLQERRDVVDGLIEFNYVPIGDIQFRIIEDKNSNGKWDTGNLVNRMEPERSELFQDSDGKDTFVTRMNWEFEIDMDMETIFAPVTMESLIQLLENREAQRLKKEAEKRAKEGTKRDENNNNANNNMNSAGDLFGGMSSGVARMR